MKNLVTTCVAKINLVIEAFQELYKIVKYKRCPKLNYTQDYIKKYPTESQEIWEASSEDYGNFLEQKS